MSSGETLDMPFSAPTKSLSGEVSGESAPMSAMAPEAVPIPCSDLVAFATSLGVPLPDYRPDITCSTSSTVLGSFSGRPS